MSITMNNSNIIIKFFFLGKTAKIKFCVLTWKQNTYAKKLEIKQNKVK